GLLDPLRTWRHVQLDQVGGPVHVVLHLVLLVLDDLLFEPPATAAPALRGFRLRFADRKLRERSVGAVVDALLLARLLLTFEADRRRLDPLVLAKAFLTLCQVLLQCGNRLIRSWWSLGSDSGYRQRGDDPGADRDEHSCVVHLHKRSSRGPHE